MDSSKGLPNSKVENLQDKLSVFNNLKTPRDIDSFHMNEEKESSVSLMQEALLIKLYLIEGAKETGYCFQGLRCTNYK